MLKPASERSDECVEDTAEPRMGTVTSDANGTPSNRSFRVRTEGINVSRTARSTLFAFALTGLGLGLNFLFSVALARWYGAADFGLFATGLAVTNALVVVVTMGFDAIVLREVPAARARAGGATGWQIVKPAIMIAGAAAVALAVALALLAQPIASRFFPEAMGIERVFMWFAAAVPLMTVGVVLLSGLQAVQDVRLRLTLRYGIDPVLRFAIGALLFVAGATILGGIFAVIAGALATAVIAFVGLRRRMTPSAVTSATTPPDRSLWLRLLRASWPLTLSSLVLVIAGRSDIVLLLGLTDASQAGLYGGALVTAAIISIILQVVETIAAPLFSDGLARAGASGIAALYRLALRWTTLLAVPIFLFFAIAADEIMALLGPEFRTAGTCFLILATAHLVNALTGSASYVLLLGNRPKTVLLNSMVYAAVIVAGNVVAIPLWGIVGAAGAMLLATTVINLLRLIEVRVIFGIHPFSMASVAPALVGAAILAIHVGLRLAGVEINPWATAFGAGLIYCIVVALACLHPDDKAVLLKARRLVRR